MGTVEASTVEASTVDRLNVAAAHGPGNGHRDRERQMEPVFVLCMGRSGSTLLRLILDTHPDLACPPETNIPALCSQLAVVWSLIEGAPLALQRGDAPPQVPDAAIAGIRQTMDLMTAPYLKRRGKRLYCDKSLAAAPHAELLTRIYPETKFICLFRHPMDVISSGLEACPWGLNGYGFDQYIAGSPGNAVMAMARYWHDMAQAIAAVEEKNPGRCHRVRYEDMVRDTERVAAGIFDFIGVDRVPGIAKAVFMRDHERFGPADHKIWHTGEISSDSVGRSAAVPIGLIPPPILEAINELAGRLGYTPIDDRWGTADMTASLLAPDGDDVKAGPPAAGTQQLAPLPEAAVLAGRLEAGVARVDGAFAGRWRPHMTEIFTVAIRQPHSDSAVCWQVDLAARTLTSGDGQPAAAGQESGEDDATDDDSTVSDSTVSDSTVSDSTGPDSTGPDWGIVATAQVWLDLLAGRLNMSAALRRNELRYCDFGENDFFVSEDRIALLASLLGLPSLADGPAIGIGQVPALADRR
jgi:Sulfotransferase family